LSFEAFAVSTGVVCGVRGEDLEKALLVGEASVGLDLVAVDPVAAGVGHVEEGLVWRKGDSVGKLQPRVDDLFGAVLLNEPDFAR
jgi:hypothetical protein